VSVSSLERAIDEGVRRGIARFNLAASEDQGFAVQAGRDIPSDQAVTPESEVAPSDEDLDEAVEAFLAADDDVEPHAASATPPPAPPLPLREAPSPAAAAPVETATMRPLPRLFANA
jgi:hypothetical protein